MSPSYRYERKFSIENYTPQGVEAIIRMHPAGFREAYPPRYVNSLYLDTLDMRCLRDTVDGNRHRKKYRIRWYGDLGTSIALPMLEIKQKNGLLGTKIQHPLTPIAWDDMVKAKGLNTLWHTSELPIPLKNELNSLQPVVVIRYLRSYYESRDRSFRLTLDQNLQSIDLHRKIAPKTSFAPLILELKYDTPFDAKAHLLTGAFPFRATKSSKYETAAG